MTLAQKIATSLLFIVTALGLGACGAGGAAPQKAATDPGEANNYVTFSKSLPSGAKVECVGWRYSGASGEGAALECFPLPTK